MTQPEKLKEQVTRFLSKDLKIKLIVMLGILGMALILISQFTGTGGGRASGQPPPARTPEFTNEEYIRMLEQRLQTLISEIDGVGRNKVMVTLESGVEYVYAQEERRSTDTTHQPGGSELAVGGRVQESIEQRFILVDTEFGRREALVLTRRPPRVQGVVIVCEGADNILVQEKLISVVTTALGIPSTRVSVVKIS